MRVLLINPFVNSKKIYGRLAAFAPFLPPLGLCYLGSYLIKHGHVVKILDLNISVETNIKEFINSFQPQIIGVTSTTISFTSAKNILKQIKSIFPEILTVLGGAHISAIPKETMEECSDIDVGVIGEGEITFKELVDFVEVNKDLKLCNGIIYRRNNTIEETASRPLIENLDILPFPARYLLRDLNQYYLPFVRGEKRSTSIITSRGCSCKCVFCTQAVFGAYMRGHSADYVCEEIKKIKLDFNIDFISFEEDFFNFNRQRLRAVCEKMIKENINIHLGCSIRIDIINEEEIELMRKAGCRVVYIGVESLNKRIQNLINKKFDKELLINKINMIKSHCLKINASFIVGFPTETKEEILDAINQAVKLPVDGEFFCLYTPFPGTPLRKLAEKEGIVSKNWDDYSNHLNAHSFYPNAIDVKTLVELRLFAYRKFYFNLKFTRKNLLNVNIISQLYKYFSRFIKISISKVISTNDK